MRGNPVIGCLPSTSVIFTPQDSWVHDFNSYAPSAVNAIETEVL